MAHIAVTPWQTQYGELLTQDQAIEKLNAIAAEHQLGFRAMMGMRGNFTVIQANVDLKFARNLNNSYANGGPAVCDLFPDGFALFYANSGHGTQRIPMLLQSENVSTLPKEDIEHFEAIAPVLKLIQDGSFREAKAKMTLIKTLAAPISIQSPKTTRGIIVGLLPLAFFANKKTPSQNGSRI